MSIYAMSRAWSLQNLTATEKLVLLKLADNANDDGLCWPSQSTIARHTGVTRESVNRICRRLEEKGMIEIIQRKDGAVNLSNHYMLKITGASDVGSQGVVTQGQKEQSVDMSSSLKRDRERDRSADIIQIFNYWQQILNHPRAKMDSKRKRKIIDRLNDGYTVTDLLQAIDGCARSAYHQGDNQSGAVYDDIELICRDGKHVDQFLKLSQQPDMRQLSSAGRRTAAAAMEWINEDSRNG